MSPFSKEFWIAKGYTPEEAEYKRNSIRPIKKEYWIERGYSEEESIKLASDKKKSNNKVGAERSKNRSDSEKRKSSPRCIEYWIERGHDEKTAKIKVGEHQSTFSLEKCISKYGLEDGTEIWKKRQLRWQESINNKSFTEKQKINKSKKSIRLNKNSDVEETIKSLNKKRNMSLVLTKEQLTEKISKDLNENPIKKYYPAEKYIGLIPKIQFEIIGKTKEEVMAEIEPLFSEKANLLRTGNKQAWRRWESGGLLRSSFEMYFYDKFTEKFPDEQIIIDKRYPDSSMRYDFLIGKFYIEICPLYGKDEKYTIKMNKKKNLFGSVLLSTIKEMDEFIEIYENNNKTHN